MPLPLPPSAVALLGLVKLAGIQAPGLRPVSRMDPLPQTRFPPVSRNKKGGPIPRAPFGKFVLCWRLCRRFRRLPDWAVRTRGPARSGGIGGADAPDWAGRVDLLSGP